MRTWSGVDPVYQTDALYRLLDDPDDSAEIMIRDHDPARELSSRISLWLEDRSLHPVRE